MPENALTGQPGTFYIVQQILPANAGEYPMTGAQAAEKEVPGSKADMLHRGRNVALAFTMQVCLLALHSVVAFTLCFAVSSFGCCSHLCCVLYCICDPLPAVMQVCIAHITRDCCS